MKRITLDAIDGGFHWPTVTRESVMFLRSNSLGKDFELPQGSVTIGRADDCQIVLDSGSVSKRHLELFVDGTTVKVRDLNSHNGSRFNQRRINGEGWIELRANDCIDICGYDFRLVDAGDSCDDSGSCIVDPSEIDSQLSQDGSHSIALSKLELDDSRQFSQLRALIAITRTLRDVLRTQDVLERTVAILFGIFSAIDRAAIGFIEDDQFEPKWWQIRQGDPDKIIRISETIVRHVAKTSQAVITSDAMRDFGDAESVQALAIRSVMCAPLIDADDQVFGLIYVDVGQPNVFTELDLEVLAAVAMQISLALNFSRLHAVAVEDAVLRVDVEKAREVQQRYLPCATPSIAGYDLAGFYRAARHVGGDYIDYIPLPDGRLAIVLGDVVGKGVPAALTMVRLATETRASWEVCNSPSQVMTRLNQKFADEFITMVALLLDPVANTVTISNAGHEPPLVRNTKREVTTIGLEFSGCPLGVLEDYEFEELTLPLHPGERLCIFSDGFPDAEHEPSGRRFGSEPILQMLQEFAGTANEFIEHAVDRVEQFTDGGPQFDDMCMVCLRRTEDSA